MSFYVDNSNILRLTGVKNQATGSYMNTASVAVTIKDLEENEVAGQTWPLFFDYVADSNGNYIAIISEDLDLIPGTEYVAEVISDNGDGLVGSWKYHFIALERRR